MDEAAQDRYAHGTGPEPRSYRIPREPVVPPGAIPREYMTRTIRHLEIIPGRQPEADREAGS
jgi:hypothetical protein